MKHYCKLTFHFFILKNFKLYQNLKGKAMIRSMFFTQLQISPLLISCQISSPPTSLFSLFLSLLFIWRLFYLCSHFLSHTHHLFFFLCSFYLTLHQALDLVRIDLGMQFYIYTYLKFTVFTFSYLYCRERLYIDLFILKVYLFLI